METQYLQHADEGVKTIKGIMFGILFALPLWLIIVSTIFATSMLVK
jgi:hypothetical protein